MPPPTGPALAGAKVSRGKCILLRLAWKDLSMGLSSSLLSIHAAPLPLRRPRLDDVAPHPKLSKMSADLIWMLTRKNSCFIRQHKGAGNDAIVRRFWKREKKSDRAGARAFCLHRTPALEYCN